MAESKNNRKGAVPPDSGILRRTLVLMLLCGVAAFAVLAARLYYLQIVKHEEYEAAAIEQQLRETVLDNGRGTIYDRNMDILAISADVETIYISPAEINMYDEDVALIAEGLSEILGIKSDKIIELAADSASWYKTVARKVDAETAEKVRKFKNEHDFKGIKIESDTKRYYPYGTLASHVIGYTGYDNIGLSGLELSLDSRLSGVPGRIVRVKNAYGTDMLYTKYESYSPGESGLNAVLTIDSSIQYYVEKHLQQAVEDYDIQNGAAAIAMDVNTGEILAMASLGNFDLNDYQAVGEDARAEIESAQSEAEKAELLSHYQQLMWRNKALSDTYEPGSTFKILTLAMALNEKTIDPAEHFYCSGRISVIGDAAGKGRKCWKTTGHGDQSLTQAMQHSCNVALIQIGQRLGAEKFYDYIDAFGLFDTTGIELSGEAKGLWWSEEIFCDSENRTQLAAASFGQTFTITPLQLIRAVSACVNGGYLMQPYLVKGFVDENGMSVSETEPEIIRQVISEETSAEIRSILEQVVCDTKEGTGKNAYVAGYRIGGKTGTSTKTVLEAGGTKEYIVSFIGFAPADDPEICILVLLDNPSSESGVYISGGNMAAPVVGKMFADILPYMGILPVYNENEAALMDRSVPDVLGLTIGEAKKLLSESGLDCKIVGGGESIIESLPDAGRSVAAGSCIILYTEEGADTGSTIMPDVRGMSYAQARESLGNAGLFICTDSLRPADSGSIAVASQSLAPGREAEVGSVIEVSLVDTDESVYGIY